jgi:hypothetical protein
MTQPLPPQDALHHLSQLLADSPNALRLRVSLSDGAVFSDDGQQRAPLPEPVPAPLLTALRRWQAECPAPLHDATAEGLRLRALCAPLLSPPAAGPQLWVERAQRPRQPLDVLVNQGWLRGDEALVLNRTLQHGGNVLITALRPSDALTLFDALLDLPDPSQGDAFFIGDTHQLNAADLPVTCLDRASLAALTPDARHSLEAWLLEARWVFCDQLTSADDVRLWAGGGALGKGRVGVLTADGPQEAIHRLHALVFPQAQLPRTHVPGLVDLLIFIDRRQTGLPQALLWQVDLATGYLIAIEDPDAPQEESWSQAPEPHEEVSLDPEADFAAPPSAEVSSGLAEAMAGAFVGLGDDLFSDDAPAAPQEPALPEMGLSFGDDELADISDAPPAMTSSSGDFSFDEDELDAAAAAASPPKATVNRRHQLQQTGAPSSTSRYNPDAIRQDAERLRNAAPSRYRPPSDAPPRRPSSTNIPSLPAAPPSAASPSSAPPSATRTPAPRASAPMFDRSAESSRSGNWRKPPNNPQAAARPSITRPPTSPSSLLHRPSNASLEELPILPSTDIEALSDGDDRFSMGSRQHQETALFQSDADPLMREGTLPPDVGDYPQSQTRLFDPSKPLSLPLPLPPPPRPAEQKAGSGLLRPPPSSDGEPNS